MKYLVARSEQFSPDAANLLSKLYARGIIAPAKPLLTQNLAKAAIWSNVAHSIAKKRQDPSLSYFENKLRRRLANLSKM